MVKLTWGTLPRLCTSFCICAFIFLKIYLFIKGNCPNFITFRAQRPSPTPGMCICVCAPGCVLCASLWLPFPILTLRYIGSPWEVLLSFTHVLNVFGLLSTKKLRVRGGEAQLDKSLDRREGWRDSFLFLLGAQASSFHPRFRKRISFY